MIGSWIGYIAALATIAAIVAGVMRWAEKRGVEKAALKAIVDADVVLRLDSVESRFDSVDRSVAGLAQQVEELRASTLPNGLNTDEIGDVAKRAENETRATRAVVDKIAEHFGIEVDDEEST